MDEGQHRLYVEEMKRTVEETIKIVVNGKIDAMRTDLSGLRNDFVKYVKDDEDWKKEAAPIVKAGISLRDVSKLAVYFFGGLATISAGLAIIKYSLISLITPK